MGYKRHQTQTEFLTELRRQCTLNFEPDVAAAMMMEVEAHLAESIQARLELGEAPEIAEINALAAFDRPERFARSMVLVHAGQATHDRTLFLLGFCFVLWVTFWILIATKGSFWFFEPVGLLVLACSFLVRSAMIGAPRWGTLRSLAVATVAFVGLVSPLTSLNLWAYGGQGNVPIGMARQLASDPGEFLRQIKDHADGAASYIDNDFVQQNADAARKALGAPLWERYATGGQQSMAMMIFCMAVLFLTHLMPLAIRRRWRARRRGISA